MQACCDVDACSLAQNLYKVNGLFKISFSLLIGFSHN
jgi:hypothetical protein